MILMTALAVTDGRRVMKRLLNFNYLPSPPLRRFTYPPGIHDHSSAQLRGIQMYQEVVSLLSAMCGPLCHVRKSSRRAACLILPLVFVLHLPSSSVVHTPGWYHGRQPRRSSRHLPLLQYAPRRVSRIRDISAPCFESGPTLRRSHPASPQADPVRLEHLCSRRYILVLRRR
jgi:hypothetical protein